MDIHNPVIPSAGRGPSSGGFVSIKGDLLSPASTEDPVRSLIVVSTSSLICEMIIRELVLKLKVTSVDIWQYGTRLATV